MDKPPKMRTNAEKDFCTTTGVEVVTPEWVKELKKHPFQRPITENKKLLEIAEKIKTTEEIPGTIQIAVFDKNMYKLDGQHRLHAFMISGVKEALAVIIYKHFDEESKMGIEYINIQGQIVRTRPDDILRAFEESSEPLQLIRKKCSFVGYDNIRRGGKGSPILGMSVLLRCWSGSTADTPISATGSAYHTAQALSLESAENCANFLLLAEKAWGSDPEYARLWTSLNLTLCMWIYQRTIVHPKLDKLRLKPDLFRIGISALSANSDYLDWLIGRTLSERHRAPAYGRIKTLIGKRLAAETGKRSMLPSAEWERWTGYNSKRSQFGEKTAVDQ